MRDEIIKIFDTRMVAKVEKAVEDKILPEANKDDVLRWLKEDAYFNSDLKILSGAIDKIIYNNERYLEWLVKNGILLEEQKKNLSKIDISLDDILKKL